MKKDAIFSICFALLFAFSAVSTSSMTHASKASEIYGVTCGMDSTEISVASNTCNTIDSYFDNMNYKVINCYGSLTTSDMVSYTVYQGETNDSAVSFYYGHCLWTDDYIYGQKNYYLYENGNTMNQDPYHRIYDAAIGTITYESQHHVFAFMWACGTAYEQGGFTDGIGPWGLSACWLTPQDGAILTEDTHGSRDYSYKCYLGFTSESAPLTWATNYSSYTLANFATKFYYYVSQGYTIDASLDYAAYDCFGPTKTFENIYLTTGYSIYNNEMAMWCYSYMREFGDGGITLT